MNITGLLKACRNGQKFSALKQALCTVGFNEVTQSKAHLKSPLRNGDEKMTNAQHLIENVIVAMENGMEINSDINTEYTNCTLDEVKEMAEHIVYSLYGGLFPKDVA